MTAKLDQVTSKSAKGAPLTMEELLSATGYNIPTLRRGQEVQGKVISVSPSEILVDVGGKSEGIVAGREFMAARDIIENLQVGDSLDATVIYPENDSGQVVLSLRKLSGDRRWAELEEKRTNDEDIEVVALEVNRGGVICEYFGVRGFLPSSQLMHSPSKTTDLIGKTLNARVIEVDRNSNRLILSQKIFGKKDLEELQKLLSKVNVGDKSEGVVTAILPFGIFVEIEIGKEDKKLEGLVHISEISWEKVDDPAKLFSVGDKVDVVVIAKEEETGRLNLSLKQLEKDPFEDASANYTQDQIVKGKVARVTPYGVFVSLDGGIEGLMHISKIPPSLSFEIGQATECTVESVDTAARRISLVPVVTEKPILYR